MLQPFPESLDVCSSGWGCAEFRPARAGDIATIGPSCSSCASGRSACSCARRTSSPALAAVPFESGFPARLWCLPHSCHRCPRTTWHLTCSYHPCRWQSGASARHLVWGIAGDAQLGRVVVGVPTEVRLPVIRFVVPDVFAFTVGLLVDDALVLPRWFGALPGKAPSQSLFAPSTVGVLVEASRGLSTTARNAVASTA